MAPCSDAGQVQRVASPKPERLLIDEFRSRPEMPSRNREDGKTIRDQLVEHCKCGRPPLDVDLRGSMATADDSSVTVRSLMHNCEGSCSGCPAG